MLKIMNNILYKNSYPSAETAKISFCPFLFSLKCRFQWKDRREERKSELCLCKTLNKRGNLFTRRSRRYIPCSFYTLKSLARLTCSVVRPSRRLTVASSCGARLWLRRINRLANRRPLRQQILAVSRTAGARMCCQLLASSSVQLPPPKSRKYLFHVPLTWWVYKTCVLRNGLKHGFVAIYESV